MNKIQKICLVSFLALVLVVGVGANSADATTTYAVNSITESGALTITPATASTWSTAAGDLTIEAGSTTAASLKLISDENTTDAINIDATAGGIDIDITGAATEDFDVLNTGGSIVLTATEAAADAIVLNASTALGGIDITSNADIDITTTGAAGEDISVTNTGGSVIITATEAVTDAIVLSASTALGGIDITSNEDIDITTTGASGEDISITNTGGSVIITATEGAADAIVLSASTAVGGIDITSNADVDITTTGAAGEDISLVNTGGSVIIQATESAVDSISIESTLGGIDILASGATAEDIDIIDTGGSINITATEAAADAIVLSASTAVGGIDITSNADIDITTTGAATEDISITNTGGSIAISATEAAVDSITIDASAEGGALVLIGGDTNPDAGEDGNDVAIEAEDDFLVETTDDVDIDVGDDFSLDGAGGSIYAIGASTTSGTITIGGSSMTAATTIYGGSATRGVNIIHSNAAVIAEAHGLDVTSTGTMSGSGALVGINSAVTTAGADGDWASGIYAKVVQGDTKNVTGYLSGAEFEVVNTNTNVSDWFPLVLNANSTTLGSHSSYIALRDYGSTDLNSFLWIEDQTIGTTSSTSLVSTGIKAASTHTLRIIIDDTPYWILLANDQND